MLQGPGQFRDALKRLLQLQSGCADELLGTLEAERTALEAGNADQLDALTGEKSVLLGRLDELGKDQVSLLSELEFDSSGSGLEQALAWCDPNRELAEQRQDLGRRLQRCRELNQRNGLTVQYRLGYVRRALDVLNGAPPGSGGVYGPDGRTSSASPSRLLASG
ncbi:MAG: flagellar protein FlgN [Wenzhouxiangella sp.]|jgi:flagellar biosynthesis/type III secretory pathway chaperone|nr:flagellar protein FlgN [Wenzhouxiangella sp.]